MFQYEAMGDANVRLVEIEDRLPETTSCSSGGRSSHRRWIRHTFSPYLEHLEGAESNLAVDALYAATDVMIWKLLRRDFRRSVATTEEVFGTLVRGVLGSLSDPVPIEHRR